MSLGFPPGGSWGGYQREKVRTRLFVSNLPRDSSALALRTHFERYGFVKSVYIPKDYHTRQPQSFGFVQFSDPRDAATALHNLDLQLFLGRILHVVPAEDPPGRKNPLELKTKEGVSDRPGYKEAHRSLQSLYTGSPRHSTPSRRSGHRSRPPRRASPTGYYKHIRVRDPQVVVGSPANESRVKLGDAWRGEACGRCGQIVPIWMHHHWCTTREISQANLSRIRQSGAIEIMNEYGAGRAKEFAAASKERFGSDATRFPG